ncbi:FAD dependent oxidoreductase [Penicillium sp. IBT 18751x]|nr:FAD dependent oxidoreductase [Penicillium sp. IBT 18751x]
MVIQYDGGSFFSVKPLLDGTIIFDGTGVSILCENPEAPSGFMKTFDDISYSNFMAVSATRGYNSRPESDQKFRCDTKV